MQYNFMCNVEWLNGHYWRLKSLLFQGNGNDNKNGNGNENDNGNGNNNGKAKVECIESNVFTAKLLYTKFCALLKKRRH